MDPTQTEAVDNFVAIAGCDREFAASFLEANGWHLESAVNAFMGSGPGGGGASASMPPAGGSGLGSNPAAAFDGFGGDFEEPRAPIAQFTDTLMGSDPAQRAPPPKPSVAANHPLEAFRMASAAGASDMDEGGDEPKEVFGLPKRPKNLAEIYAAPTELCFTGSFEELRAAGRKEQKWLLINIQSPTEFASQQLNADTWRDETLRAVIGSSFLFWQQYYDSAAGSSYCRYYLQNATGPTPVGLPHIAVVDPITAASVKTWTGFKDAERLMDKLMEYADDPPQEMSLDLGDSSGASQQLSPPKLGGGSALGGGGSALGGGGGGAGDSVEDQELAAAIAASLAGGGAADAAPPAPPAAPAGPSPEEIDAQWGPPAEEPANGVPLKIRTLDGSTLMRKFAPTHTLRDVLAAVHASGCRLDPAKQYKLSMQFGPSVSDQSATLEAAGLQRGAYNLAEC